MSTHYVDLGLLSDPEFSQAHLLGALYGKLHRALVQLGVSDIGVTFPQYSLEPRDLGKVLRLHGNEEALKNFLAVGWLGGLHDHVGVSSVLSIPTHVEHRQLQRRQFKTSVERLRHRRMRRKGEAYEQAAAAIPDSVERQPDLPYVQLRSGSTGHSFCLFLELGEPQAEPVEGEFNSYGLSRTATLPWF